MIFVGKKNYSMLPFRIIVTETEHMQDKPTGEKKHFINGSTVRLLKTSIILMQSMNALRHKYINMYISRVQINYCVLTRIFISTALSKFLFYCEQTSMALIGCLVTLNKKELILDESWLGCGIIIYCILVSV